MGIEVEAGVSNIVNVDEVQLALTPAQFESFRNPHVRSGYVGWRRDCGRAARRSRYRGALPLVPEAPMGSCNGQLGARSGRAGRSVQSRRGGSSEMRSATNWRKAPSTSSAPIAKDSMIGTIE